MIIATQLVVRYGLIKPMIENEYRVMDITLELQFPLLQFIFLILATVLICASGYIINDYFDVNSDMVNKPHKVIVGKFISRRTAMTLHWVFNIVGVILGGIASYSVGYLNFTLLFVFIAGLLWFYSTTFSKEPFVGNIIVSLLVAFVPLIVAIYELLPLNFMYKNILNSLFLSFEQLLFWSLGYAIFAFLLSLIREMVKDVEDLEGDAAYGRNTIPIAYGVKIAKYVTTSIFAVTLIALVWVQLAYVQETVSGIFIFAAIILPLLVAGFLFLRADSSKEYHTVSLLLKLIMVMGLIFIPLKNYVFI